MHTIKILGIILLAIYLILGGVFAIIGLVGFAMVLKLIGLVAGVLLLISISCFRCNHKTKS